MTALVAAIALIASPQPVALLSGPQPIGAFAISSANIAYMDARTCRVEFGPVHRLRVVKSGLFFCGTDAKVALAGVTSPLSPRVAWAGYPEVKCSDHHWIVATVGRVLENRSPNCFQGGEELTALTSDGRNLYYSYVGFEETRDCANTANSCVFTQNGGAVVKVVNGKKQVMRGVPPAMLLAADGNRIAIVRPGLRFAWNGKKVPGTFPLPATGPLEVRGSTTGTLIRSTTVDGQAEALALSGDIVAVVTVKGGKRTLSWDGKRLALGTANVDALAVEGTVIAYRAGRLIRAISVTTGKELARWTARGTAVGLALQGRHVAWAENSGGRGKILNAAVPGP